MSDELRAAAERVRRINAGDFVLDVYPGAIEKPHNMLGQWSKWHAEDMARSWVMDDCETLADAYLAEHPADERELITEAWLRSVGFEDFVSFDHNGKCLEAWPIVCVHKWNGPDSPETWSVVVRSTAVPATNRGDVRKLAAALGIPLKETP